MIKLTFIQNVLFLFGYRYIANKRTKEIHDLQYLNCNCHNELIKSKKYITTKSKNELLTTDYNGCRWCMKNDDTD